MTFGDTFLTHPELFPARLAGEAAGEQQLVAEIAGESALIEGLNRYQADLIGPWLADLSCLGAPDSEKGIRAQVFRAPKEDFLDIRHPEDDQFVEQFDLAWAEDSVSLAGRHAMGRLDWSREFTGGLWTFLTDSTLFRGLFENFLRVALAYRLLQQGGVLLHSSSVVVGDKAHVFFGQSGSGKTTVARMGLERGNQVLSDDLNAVLFKDGRPQACRMPFFGDLGPTEGVGGWYPLGGIHRLRKGSENVFRPMRRAEAVGEAMACAPYLNQDPYRHDSLIEQLTRLFGQVPARELTFSREGDFWGLLENADA